jgi:hypothetical protein
VARSASAKKSDAPSREVTASISPSVTKRNQCGVPAGTWASAPGRQVSTSSPTPTSTSPFNM